MPTGAATKPSARLGQAAPEIEAVAQALFRRKPQRRHVVAAIVADEQRAPWPQRFERQPERGGHVYRRDRGQREHQ